MGEAQTRQTRRPHPAPRFNFALHRCKLSIVFPDGLVGGCHHIHLLADRPTKIVESAVPPFACKRSSSGACHDYSRRALHETPQNEKHFSRLNREQFVKPSTRPCVRVLLWGPNGTFFRPASGLLIRASYIPLGIQKELPRRKKSHPRQVTGHICSNCVDKIFLASKGIIINERQPCELEGVLRHGYISSKHMVVLISERHP